MTASSHNIQQFIGDGLLAVFVVLQRQFLDQVVGVVVGCLHGKHAGGMLGSDSVEQGRVDVQMEHFGEQ